MSTSHSTMPAPWLRSAEQVPVVMSATITPVERTAVRELGPGGPWVVWVLFWGFCFELLRW